MIRASVSKISRSPGEKEPLVHIRLNVGVKVPARLIELAASKVAKETGLILIPHVTRIPEDEDGREASRQATGRESLNPIEEFREELRLDEFTAKLLSELIVAASEGDEEGVESVLDKLASWPKSLEQLRGLVSQ